MPDLDKLILNKNKKKQLFTPGPSSILKENILGLGPCFGRNDADYKKTEKYVLNKLKKISGHKEIVCTQGSGSTALEIVALNFLRGKILIISTGFYSERLYNISKLVKKTHKFITKVQKVNWKQLKNVKGEFDWVWACPVETSKGLKIPILEIKNFSDKIKAKLALDATASIGLEENHNLAEVISFSSCKGLMGLTGACFVNYNTKPKNKVNSFVLNIKNLKSKKMTGPYHTIQSLMNVLKKYEYFRQSIFINKNRCKIKFKKNLVYNFKNQPQICSYISKKIKYKNKKKAIIYKPRASIKGSIISHLGEAHLGKKSKGKILNFVSI